MPMPVIILIVVLAVAAVCAAAFFAVRAYKHRKLAEQLDKRDDDQVHYAFAFQIDSGKGLFCCCVYKKIL